MARWNTPHGLCASVWALCAREKIVGSIFLNNNNIENVESCVQIFGARAIWEVEARTQTQAERGGGRFGV